MAQSHAGHDHTHHHGHAGSGGAALTFLVLAPIEMLLGVLLHNPALTSLGGHDLTDGGIPLLVLAATWLIGRLRGHWPACQAGTWVAFIIGLSNIALIGGLSLLASFHRLDRAAVIWGSLGAVISFLANGYWYYRLRGHEVAMMHAFSNHLKLDAVASVLAGVGGAAAYWADYQIFALMAGAGILGITLWDTVPELWALTHDFHRKNNHGNHAP